MKKSKARNQGLVTEKQKDQEYLNSLKLRILKVGGVYAIFKKCEKIKAIQTIHNYLNLKPCFDWTEQDIHQALDVLESKTNV